MSDNRKPTTENRTPSVLFVRSGGGLPGLDIHAGIWLALEQAGIRATHCSGTSAGAIVSAADACGYTALDFARSILAPLSDSDIRDSRIAWQLRLPWIASVHDNGKICRFLHRYLEGRYAQKPCEIWATRMQDAERVDLGLCQSLTTACLASSAVPGLLPPVSINGQEHIDGGVRFNLPLPQDWRTYDHVYLLIASPRIGDYKGTSALTNAIRAFQTLMTDQILDVVDETRSAPNVSIIWPDCHTEAGVLHFDHSLIEKARTETAYMLHRPMVASIINEEFKRK
jgi:NTE family protein